MRTLFYSMAPWLEDQHHFTFPPFLTQMESASAFLMGLLDDSPALHGDLPPRIQGAPLFTKLGGAIQLERKILIFRKENEQITYLPALFSLSNTPQSVMGYTIFFEQNLWGGVTNGIDSDAAILELEILDRRLGAKTITNLGNSRRNGIRNAVDTILENAKDAPDIVLCPPALAATYKHVLYPAFHPFIHTKDTLPVLPDLQEDLDRIARLIYHRLTPEQRPNRLHVGLGGHHIGQRGDMSSLYLRTSAFSELPAGFIVQLQNKLTDTYEPILETIPWVDVPGTPSVYQANPVDATTSAHQFMEDMAWLQNKD